MNFIKLTDRESKTPIYVSIEAICLTYSDYNVGAIVELKNGENHWISETPEEIMKIIDNALTKITAWGR